MPKSNFYLFLQMKSGVLPRLLRTICGRRRTSSRRSEIASAAVPADRALRFNCLSVILRGRDAWKKHIMVSEPTSWLSFVISGPGGGPEREGRRAGDSALSELEGPALQKLELTQTAAAANRRRLYRAYNLRLSAKTQRPDYSGMDFRP